MTIEITVSQSEMFIDLRVVDERENIKILQIDKFRLRLSLEHRVFNHLLDEYPGRRFFGIFGVDRIPDEVAGTAALEAVSLFLGEQP